MFGSKTISTISLLEKQIQTLEYALMRITVADYDLYTQVLTELGHLYNSKMQILKITDHATIEKTANIKTYPSKINFERDEAKQVC